MYNSSIIPWADAAYNSRSEANKMMHLAKKISLNDSDLGYIIFIQYSILI